VEKIKVADKLSLTNDGELDICFIGVGSAFAQKNCQTNFLIVKGDQHIMVDFGMTGPAALKKNTGLDVTNIECVLPTHSHADHVGGLECIALMNRYVGMRFMDKPKVNIVLTEEYQRVLWDQTLRGGLEWNESPDGGGQCLHMADFFDIVRPKWKTMQPRETWSVKLDGLTIELFRTMHIPEQSMAWEASFVSYGLFIDGRVFVSGDTRFDTELIDQYADKSEVMFHDVQFFPGAVHASLEELKGLPEEVKNKMYLMHYADNYDEQDISDFAGWAEEGMIYRFERNDDEVGD